MDCRSIAPLIALLVSAPAAAQTPDDPPPAAEPTVISGPAEIVDGDTLKISGARIRLFGIDAPEMAEWPWGPRARSALEDLVDGRTVTCLQRDTDRYDRPVATCATADTPDLAEALIAAGHAITYRRFTARTELHGPYMAAEARARSVSLGAWVEAAPVEPRWLRLLDRFQSGLGALLGLLALLGGALFNAWLTRRRDDRLREHEKRSVAAELAAEIATIRREIDAEASLVEAAAVFEGNQIDTTRLGKVRRQNPVFQANLGRLGSFEPETAAHIVRFGRSIENYPSLADIKFLTPEMINTWVRISRNVARDAHDLAWELATRAGVDPSYLGEPLLFESIHSADHDDTVNSGPGDDVGRDTADGSSGTEKNPNRPRSGTKSTGLPSDKTKP